MDRIRAADLLFTSTTSAVHSRESAETATALLRAGDGGTARTALALEYVPGLAERDVYRGVFDELAPHTGIVFGRENEIRDLLGESSRGRDLATHLTVEYDLDVAVLLRAGHSGVMMENSPRRNRVHERVGPETDSVDPSGVLGATVGGFCNALLGGADPTEALDAGLAAGALAQTMTGPFMTATAAELDAMVDRLTEGSP
jgi:sugar/nucleoside kinase (ribokinase family)